MNMDGLSALGLKTAYAQAAKKEKGGKSVDARRESAAASKTAKAQKADAYANESGLSQKAQDLLKDLRAKYGDYDFFVGGGSDDLKALSGSGNKEFSVIFSNEELERMANDEEYAAEKMDSVESAVRMSKRICGENGFVSAFAEADGAKGVINKISIALGDDGSMKIFAEIQKNSDQMKERMEKDFARRTVIEASSEEEFIEKIRNLDWTRIAPAYSGDKFTLSV